MIDSHAASAFFFIGPCDDFWYYRPVKLRIGVGDEVLDGGRLHQVCVCLFEFNGFSQNVDCGGVG